MEKAENNEGVSPAADGLNIAKPCMQLMAAASCCCLHFDSSACFQIGKVHFKLQCIDMHSMAQREAA